jgi:hypothetical protein
VAEESYDRIVGLIFEKEDDKAKVEARCWSELDLRLFQRNGTSALHAEARDVSLERPSAVTPSQPARFAVLDLDLEQLSQFVHVRPSSIC